jgi:hypothetical protein
MVSLYLLRLVWAIDVPCSGNTRGEELWCERVPLEVQGRQATVGTDDALVQNFENVFQDEFVDVLISEAKAYDAASATTSTLSNNKRVTFWLPWDAKPRTGTEQAVLLLKELTFPGGKAPLKIDGMKYWYQYRHAEEDVGFHYDKDEGMASDMQRMRFPYINTLVYLSDVGAPTIFFNGTTTHNGNRAMPTVPANGWVVYPKKNKWTLQRGDLLHGAQADMALVRPTPSRPRITLVVSFEDVQVSRLLISE